MNTRYLWKACLSCNAIRTSYSRLHVFLGIYWKFRGFSRQLVLLKSLSRLFRRRLVHSCILLCCDYYSYSWIWRYHIKHQLWKTIHNSYDANWCHVIFVCYQFSSLFIVRYGFKFSLNERKAWNFRANQILVLTQSNFVWRDTLNFKAWRLIWQIRYSWANQWTALVNLGRPICSNPPGNYP